MQLHELNQMPQEMFRDLMSKDCSRWQPALVALAVFNDKFSEAKAFEVCFYEEGKMQ